MIEMVGDFDTRQDVLDGEQRRAVCAVVAGILEQWALDTNDIYFHRELGSPKSSLLMSSSVLWGSAVGSMFGYGATAADQGYGKSNDGASRGGLIGFNVGLAAAAGLSTVYIPTYKALGAMWLTSRRILDQLLCLALCDRSCLRKEKT